MKNILKFDDLEVTLINADHEIDVLIEKYVDGKNVKLQLSHEEAKELNTFLIKNLPVK